MSKSTQYNFNIMLYSKKILKYWYIFVTFIFIFIYILFFKEPYIAMPKANLLNDNINHTTNNTRRQFLKFKNFRYLLNSNICHGNGNSSSVFSVVIVHSHPSHIKHRNLIRTQLPNSLLEEIGLRRVFLLARTDRIQQSNYPSVKQNIIEEEHQQHKDLVQWDFDEHYRNLTYKHLMGLQWTKMYCPMAKWVIKMDDDIVVDLFQVRDILKYKYNYDKKLIVGLLQIDAVPVRNPISKWYVSREEYPGHFYADFVSGWMYVVTAIAVSDILKVAKKEKLFWIDDVFITGTLAAKAYVEREAMNKHYTLNVDHLYCCIEPPDSREYLCDFFAGPSEGDLEIMKEYLNCAVACYYNTCTRRLIKKSISRTCARAKSPPLVPPGPGIGTIIKLQK